MAQTEQVAGNWVSTGFRPPPQLASEDQGNDEAQNNRNPEIPALFPVRASGSMRMHAHGIYSCWHKPVKLASGKYKGRPPKPSSYPQ
jgi:hypothetical protein